MHGHDIGVVGFSAGEIAPLLPAVAAVRPLGGLAGALRYLIARAALA